MKTHDLRPFAVVALVALALAAATGSLLRFGLYLGMPAWAQNFMAVRHAHSHLMYFGWGTLGMMVLIWHLLPRFTGRPLPRGVGGQMAATSVVALLSLPGFWSNGYGPTQIGPLSLPLGAMVSGWNGVAWFVFIWLYWRATRQLGVRPLPVQLWDWAIVLLLLACAGVLGMLALTAMDHPSIFLHQATLHLFLDLFAVGWFTLALLGLLWAWISQHAALPRWLPTQSLALCLAPTFFLGISPVLVPEPIYWVAVLANLGAGMLLGRHLWALWRRRAHLPALVRLGSVALGIHVLIAAALLWPGLWRWGAGTQLRIFFLHNLLLGWLSSLLLALILEQWVRLASVARRLIEGAWIGGVGFMLVALLGLGLAALVPWAPAAFWLRLAAWSSVLLVGVVLVVLGILVCGGGRRRQTIESPNRHLNPVGF